jgi:mersacidin/lichenicidin family type 2 lantibiotic
MSVVETVRAWRDQDYWLGLTDEERAEVPTSPVGDLRDMKTELDLTGNVVATFTDCCGTTCGTQICTLCCTTHWTGAVCCE